MKIYEQQWYGDNALAIPAGRSEMTFSLPFVHEALIKKLIVQQRGGTLTTFTVDVYNLPVEPLGSETSESEAESSVPDVLAKVIPTLVQSTPGQAGEILVADTAGYAFRNMEGTNSRPVRRIYLKIATGQVTGSTWDVALGYMPQGSRD